MTITMTIDDYGDNDDNDDNDDIYLFTMTVL